MPTAIPTPTPALEEQVLALLSTNWPVVAAGCGGLMLIAALFLLLRPRRPKQPTPRPTKPLTPEGPYLEGSTVSGQQLRFALKPEGCTIGREPSNDLVITADLPGWETVSRRHARLYAQAGRWIVEDLNSMNGIYVNGRRTGRNLLYDGWELRIGGVVFTFHTGAGGGLI
ncbi:MAG: FHA domain-containing protein [Anaerolineae bacterium]|nr:FHA domain-containing protein [Anaerolineae bacterium]